MRWLAESKLAAIVLTASARLRCATARQSSLSATLRAKTGARRLAREAICQEGESCVACFHPAAIVRVLAPEMAQARNYLSSSSSRLRRCFRGIKAVSMNATISTANYIVWDTDKTAHGPVELATLISWVRGGRVVAGTWVFASKGGIWERAANLPLSLIHI